MVFRFYISINKDLKVINEFTHSVVCLHNIIHDLCEAMSTEAMKKIEHNTLKFGLPAGEVTWILREDKLYRYYKRYTFGDTGSYKTASLMMRNVLNFDVFTCFLHNDQLANFASGFKVFLELPSVLNSFEHHVAIRRL